MADVVRALARPRRAPVPPLPPFEALDRTHRAILEALADFDRLLAHVDESGADEDARRTASTLHALFEGHAAAHHAAEERDVFPLLLAGATPELASAVQRLQQDHGWLEEDWLELAPQIEAIAKGYSWYDLAMLKLALPVFAALYREHIALEESLVYPAARRRQVALDDGAKHRAP